MARRNIQVRLLLAFGIRPPLSIARRSPRSGTRLPPYSSDPNPDRKPRGLIRLRPLACSNWRAGCQQVAGVWIDTALACVVDYKVWYHWQIKSRTSKWIQSQASWCTIHFEYAFAWSASIPDIPKVGNDVMVIVHISMFQKWRWWDISEKKRSWTKMAL